MPIVDPIKRRISWEKRLYMKICRKCGVRIAPKDKKCRKCKSKNLRWKRRELTR